MSKYDVLARELGRRGGPVVQMTFDEVDYLLEGGLPPSAHKYRRWWANCLGNGHAADGWLGAGYRVDKDGVDKEGRTVRFRKADTPRTFPAATADVEVPADEALARLRDIGFESAGRWRGVNMAVSSIAIEGREFTLIGNIRAVRRSDGSICLREPQTLYKKVATSKLHAYGHGTFCKFDVDDAPNAPGVYFMVLRGEIQYVGETVNLRNRFKNGYGNISPKNCFINGQATNCRINKLILEVLRCGDQVEVWFCRCKDHKELEKPLKASLSPPWNLEGKR